MTAAKPSLWQRIAYAYGKRLPDSMRTWVAEDLAVVTTAPASTSQKNVQRIGFQLLYTRAVLVGGEVG